MVRAPYGLSFVGGRECLAEDQDLEAVGRMRLGRAVKGLLLGLVLALLSAASPVLATEYHGQVVFGGLPVPGSQVTVTATQGDKKVSAITDDQGLFTFPDLADGAWTLSIEMTGFAPLKEPITVAPNAPVVAFELKLMTLDQIRAEAKPVKVDASAPAVATSAPAAEPAGEAPAAGKTPAAANSKAGAAKTQQAGAAPPEAPAAQPAPDSNAQAANDGFLINGSVNNAATSQFSLNQAFGNARNSRSLYNYGLMFRLDSSTLDAKNYSPTGFDSPKPSTNNFTVGLQFGGPLKIPHLLPLARAPNFYIGYNRIQNASVNTQQTLMPTAAEAGGDLSGLASLTGQTIYAPATGLSAACLATPGVTPGAAFAGNIIPAACISPVATALLKLYPAPNFTGLANFNYQLPLSTDSHTDAAQVHLQKQLGNKNNVSGTYAIQSVRQSSPNIFGFVDPQDNVGMSVNPIWYHRFSQRLSMNASYNFNRQRNRTTTFFENKQNVSQNVGVAGNDQDPTNWGPPSLGFQQSGVQGLYDGTSQNNRNEQNAISLNVSWNRFRHNMNFGGDFKRQEFNYFQQSNPRGTLSFTGAATQSSAATGGSDFADFLLGLPDTSQIAFGNADKYLRQSVYDLFANDDFRVNPELSINYGVRWEYGAPMTELKNRLVNLDIAPGFTAETPVLASNPTGALTGQRYPTSLMRPDKIGIAPIIGIAWRPISGSSLLVRSGFGIYHDISVYQNITYAMAQQAPLSTSLSVPNSPTCRFNIASPFQQLPCSSITPDTFGVDPNFRVGYAQSWYLSVARDLPAALQLTVTYKGVKGVRGVQEYLPNTYPVGGVNPCPLCPSGYYYRTSNGNSTYEAGTVQLRRRLRAGLQASANYTFSKALDDDFSYGGSSQVQAGTSSAGSSLVAQDWRHPEAQRGLSTFDQRNVLALQFQYTTGMGLGGRPLMSGWRGLIYKEWTILTNINMASGLPLTPIDPIAVPGSGYTNIIRADYNGGAVHQYNPATRAYLNPAAFSAPLPGQWGTAGRDSITGPNQFSLNASMQRGFRVHDRYNLTAQIDAINVLNHVTFAGWNTTVPTISSSGTSANSQFGTVTSGNGMRSLSITLRARY